MKRLNVYLEYQTPISVVTNITERERLERKKRINVPNESEILLSTRCVRAYRLIGHILQFLSGEV